MPLETNGFDGLMTDIAGMASRMDADGSGAPVAKRILEAAAQPIHQQMKANATKDPRRRSGDLHDALKVGGPAPAPAHPYIRPAYDTRADEAYEIIRDGLRDAIDRL